MFCTILVTLHHRYDNLCRWRVSKALLTWRVSRLARGVSADVATVAKNVGHVVWHTDFAHVRLPTRPEGATTTCCSCHSLVLPILSFHYTNYTNPQIWALREYFLLFFIFLGIWRETKISREEKIIYSLWDSPWISLHLRACEFIQIVHSRISNQEAYFNSLLITVKLSQSKCITVYYYVYSILLYLL